MKKLLAIACLLLILPAASSFAGCTSNTTPRETIEDTLAYLSGVCGFTITLNISVTTYISAPYVDGDLHYRDYTVVTHVEAYDSPVPVASRNLSDPRISGNYRLWNDAVGPWNGIPFNYWRTQDGTPVAKYTATETGSSESDEIYDVPKPGMYVMAFGNRYTFSEIIVNTAEQVASYLRVRFADDGSGNMLPFEFKVPLEGIIPEYTYPGPQKIVWYEVEFYCPLGGSLFEQIPDTINCIAYDTTQHFMAGYTQNVLSLTGPGWRDLLVSAALSTFCPTAGMAYLFGAADWGAVTYLEVGLNYRPHDLEAREPAPDSSEIGRTIPVAIQMY